MSPWWLFCRAAIRHSQRCQSPTALFFSGRYPTRPTKDSDRHAFCLATAAQHMYITAVELLYRCYNRNGCYNRKSTAILLCVQAATNCCTSFAGASLALPSRWWSPRCSFRRCSWKIRHFTPGCPTSTRYTSRFLSRIYGEKQKSIHSSG